MTFAPAEMDLWGFIDKVPKQSLQICSYIHFGYTAVI